MLRGAAKGLRVWCLNRGLDPVITDTNFSEQHLKKSLSGEKVLLNKVSPDELESGWDFIFLRLPPH
jgi:hypothetical protein